MQSEKQQAAPARSDGEQALLDQLLDQAKRVADPSSDGWRYGLEPRTNEELERFAKWVAESGFRKDLKSPGAAAILIAAGRVQGLGVFAALECFDVVYGRPFLRGKAARAFLLRSPLVDLFEIAEDPDDQDPPTKAVIEVTRKGWKAPKRVTFTIDEARRLGLLDRKKDDGSTAQTGWHTQPGVMLIERCTTKCIRRHFPDLLLGLGLEDEEDLEPKASSAVEIVAEAKGGSLKEMVEKTAPKKGGSSAGGERAGSRRTFSAETPEGSRAAVAPAPKPGGGTGDHPNIALKGRLQAAWDEVKAKLGEDVGQAVWTNQIPEDELACISKSREASVPELAKLVESAELLARRVRLAEAVNAARKALQDAGGPQATPVSVPGKWGAEDLEKMLAGDRKQLEALQANKGD